MKRYILSLLATSCIALHGAEDIKAALSVISTDWKTIARQKIHKQSLDYVHRVMQLNERKLTVREEILRDKRHKFSQIPGFTKYVAHCHHAWRFTAGVGIYGVALAAAFMTDKYLKEHLKWQGSKLLLARVAESAFALGVGIGLAVMDQNALEARVDEEEIQSLGARIAEGRKLLAARNAEEQANKITDERMKQIERFNDLITELKTASAASEKPAQEQA